MGILVPLNVFLFAKTLLVGWGGGEGRRDHFILSQKCLFFVFYITEQIFLWIPYSQGFMIDNEGSCRIGRRRAWITLSVSSFAAKVCSAKLCLGMDTYQMHCTATVNGTGVDGPAGPSQESLTPSSIPRIFCFFLTLWERMAHLRQQLLLSFQGCQSPPHELQVPQRRTKELI